MRAWLMSGFFIFLAQGFCFIENLPFSSKLSCIFS